MVNLTSIPSAYSLEMETVLSADDAYDYFWAGKLIDKRKFKCPDTNCHATYTCANMDKEENELLQIPHFRKTSEHSEDCSLLKVPVEATTKIGSKTSSTVEPDQPVEIGEFILVRPELKVREQAVNDSPETYQYINSVGEPAFHYSASRKYYSIRPIVERFFDLRESGKIDRATIKIDDHTFPLKYLFKGIFNQDIEQHQEYRHIYWGVAFINSWGQDGYRISFTAKMFADGEEIRPSSFVSDEQLDSYPQGKRLRRYLSKKSVDENASFITFLYGMPTHKVSKGRDFVNFDLDNLDFLDFRTTDYYEKLKRKDDFPS